MIKRSKFLALVLLLLLSPLFSSGQGLDHRLGEILFQLKNDDSINDFLYTIQDSEPDLIKANTVENISKSFNLWKISFDANAINEVDLLNLIAKNKLIQLAQFNYFTQNRAEPDDYYFSSLWHLNNTGQLGGMSGADLDATLAWDHTTGGVTYYGDTVVICIIDERFDLSHEDLAANVWINHGEIPDNNIDDDGNGYEDDYWGWNVNSNDDNIGNNSDNDWHGTAVSGVAGAVGNNGIGMSGVAWNIKLMLVSRGNTTADAVISYSYPFANRKKYNESLGQEGAFVVATNTSWGVDYGSPDDQPIWCAMYDSLGSVGILNAAATINADEDVDVVGDLPTTCASDFLISTTSVDNNDVKVTNAGYGVQHIDLAAFGNNVFSTLNNDAYGYVNGTSIAAPQVAATIGLMHTVPCPSFATLAINSPEQAALMLKDYILNGTEILPSLEGITLTGGRLNVKNSIELLINNCDYSGCYGPFEVTVNAASTSAIINWINDSATTGVNLQYRKIGASNWTQLYNLAGPVILQNLEACSEYEIQVQSICGTAFGSYSNSISFQTDGCCTAPSFIEFEAGNGFVGLNWEEITAAISYELRYKEVGSSEWTNFEVFDNYLLVDGLLECQEYEFQIKTICSNIQSFYSPSYLFTTLGCGACLENDYCLSSGPSGSLSWINKVSIANLDHISGLSGNGYSDFTDQSIHLIQGFVHEINISTDFNLIQLPGLFNVWIDLNQDGVFGGSERLLQSSSYEVASSGILYIPETALLGSTRMRVSFLSEDMGACGIGSSIGEVEDYCVFIAEPTECLPPVNFNFESTENSINLTWSGNSLVDEYLLRYRELGTLVWNTETTTENYFTINDLSICTDYEYCLTSICNGETSASSPIVLVTTKGCGTCLDLDYCPNLVNSVDFEWIERFVLNDLENVSGSNGGYMHFQDFTTDLITGELYPIEVEPGFANSDDYLETFSAWIDYNQDGEFDNWTEKILDEVSLNGATVSNAFTVPEDAITGSTRLRVSMKYGNFVETPCEGGFEGEIEEYCINIYNAQSDGCTFPIFDHHEPLDSFSVLVNWFQVADAISYKLRYRPSANTLSPWQYITTSNESAILNNLMTCEDYDVQIQTICELGISDFGNTQIINACTIVATNELETSVEINVFPNPFSGSTNLSIKTDQQEFIKVEILNGLGQKVKTFEYESILGENRYELDLKDLQSGVYFLNVFRNGKDFQSRKLVKM